MEMIMSIISLVVNLTVSQVVINEVMANPAGSESGSGSPGDRNEFIELYNATDDTIDLANWIITDLDDDDLISFWTDTLLVVKYPSVRIRSTKMMPRSFALILDPEYTSSDTAGGHVEPYAFPDSTLIVTVKNTTLGNGLANNDPLVLKDKLGNTVSTFGTPENEDDFPADAGDGKSWERISPTLPDSKNSWRVSSDRSGSTPGRPNSTGIDENKQRANKFGLNAPLPNPWTGRTTVGFFLPEEGEVLLAVYAVDGRLAQQIFSGVQSAGYHEVGVSLSHLVAGSYFVRLKAGAGVALVKTTVLK
jgi:hypothetical protein